MHLATVLRDFSPLCIYIHVHLSKRPLSSCNTLNHVSHICIDIILHPLQIMALGVLLVILKTIITANTDFVWVNLGEGNNFLTELTLRLMN